MYFSFISSSLLRYLVKMSVNQLIKEKAFFNIKYNIKLKLSLYLFYSQNYLNYSGYGSTWLNHVSSSCQVYNKFRNELNLLNLYVSNMGIDLSAMSAIEKFKILSEEFQRRFAKK